MKLTHHQGGWIIFTSFIIALMLTMVPLPDWVELLRPEWVTLVLIYWCMALPERIGIGIAWMLGLLLDVLHGAVFGQYALALVIIALLTLKFHQRIRLYPLWQQAIVVMAFILLEQLLVLWVKGVIGQSPGTWLYWLPSLTSMLFWPWVFLLLRDLRRHYSVR
jgi:rod shape-determining protein MreD